MNTYLQISMSVTITMEIVNTAVLTPLVLITASAILDIDYLLIGIAV